ncbi:helix-turn-helix domain-containing protein [Consotaella aegiceratis]|uniref:helix-turn-helix domain-containing protein n=1 Tax=Consotaella aegiceratis TaxID=3097961 RepID=UPI002F3F72E3
MQIDPYPPAPLPQADVGAMPSGDDTERQRQSDTVRGRCILAREIAGAMMDVPVADIARPQRSKAGICEARHVAMYLAHVIFQLSLTAIAVDFGRDRTSVAHAVRRIEDQRDDDAFDRLLCRLERLATSCDELLQRAERAHPEAADDC